VVKSGEIRQAGH